jgi:phosphoribosyl 1,2-cyclic phosphodiesterase
VIQFKPLASSSAGCCYVLSGGGAKAPLLLDCGIRYRLIQIGMNFAVSTLAGCLISHAHGDHIAAADKLIEAGVHCYASEETWTAYNPDSRSHYSNVLRLGEQAKVGDWSVIPCEAVHDAPGTFGFLIGSPEGDRILYLTDSAYAKNKFPGLTHLLIECNFDPVVIKDNARGGKIDGGRYRRVVKTHMSIDTLIDFLKANDLSKLREIHLLHLSAANSDAVSFKRRVQEATGVPTYIADELSREVIRS